MGTCVVRGEVVRRSTGNTKLVWFETRVSTNDLVDASDGSHALSLRRACNALLGRPRCQSEDARLWQHLMVLPRCRREICDEVSPSAGLASLTTLYMKLTDIRAGETAFDGFFPAASTTRAVDNAATTTRSLSGRIWRRSSIRRGRISCPTRGSSSIG